MPNSWIQKLSISALLVVASLCWIPTRAAIEKYTPNQISLEIRDQFSGNTRLEILNTIHAPMISYGKKVSYILVNARSNQPTELRLLINGQPVGNSYHINAESGRFYFHPFRNKSTLGNLIQKIELEVVGSIRVDTIIIGLE